ncbi:cation diffusion facilitator family transporter [Catalinimonas alkaloidigena]|uniref:cation diffusion facilitator family transporter n=1 Tax=Catalinimonas alkaloidigena TaxID=1075417 RepID=UPI0024058C7C|nr:cation diffusion facilitator family transporter [Catalinimonas alkaloidigena]MDF9795793.1 cation diffusion facilitator family transporter [Catalinimonas alkaloidigena]
MSDRIDKIIRAAWVGIVGNALLALIKMVVGFTANSQAVIGDGIDTLSDVATYVIILFTARISQKPPSVKYPYGYQRAETIASKFLSFFIFFAGAQLFYVNVKDLISGVQRDLPDMLAVYATVFSMLVKFLMASWQFKVGKKTNSSMLIANAKNMRADIILSLSVLIGIAVTLLLKMPIIDTVIAIGVSLWILRIGFKIFMESNTELMDGVDDTSAYEKVFEAADAVKGAHNPHRARIRKMSNLYLIDLDIEVDARLSVAESHKISIAVEQEIKERLENVYDIMIHIEPKGNYEVDEKFGLSRRNL